MAVVSDHLEGTSLTQTKEGYEHTRTFIVSELTGDASKKLLTALNTPGIPRRFDRHPTIPLHECDSRSAEAIEPDMVRVTAVYRQSHLIAPDVDAEGNEYAPADSTLSVGSTVQEVETERDVGGNQITVRHTYDSGTDDEKTVIAPAKVAYRVAMSTVNFTRREPRNPRGKSQGFVGRVNATRVFDDPPRFWMCTRLAGNSRDGGKTFDVEYEFQRSVANIDDLTSGFGTWDPYVAFIDPETGEIPTDLVKGVGLKQVKVLPEIDFRRLGI